MKANDCLEKQSQGRASANKFFQGEFFLF